MIYPTISSSFTIICVLVSDKWPGFLSPSLRRRQRTARFVCMYCTVYFTSTSTYIHATYRHFLLIEPISLTGVQCIEFRILVTPSPRLKLLLGTWCPKAAGYSLKLGGIFIISRALDGIDQTKSVHCTMVPTVRLSSGMNRRAGADVTASPPLYIYYIALAP